MKISSFPGHAFYPLRQGLKVWPGNEAIAICEGTHEDYQPYEYTVLTKIANHKMGLKWYWWITFVILVVAMATYIAAH